MQGADGKAVLDEEALAELREDLGDAFAPFVRRFLGSAREGLAEIAREVAAEDWAPVSERAHGLKGSAAYLGADELAAGLGALQHAARSEAAGEVHAALARAEGALSRVAPLLEALCEA